MTAGASTDSPTVTVAIPVLNEQAHLGACLDAIASQTYAGIVEVLVADGGSTDATCDVAASHPGVRVLDNPGRIQSAGLNVALTVATGDIIVRVDGHCVVEADYVERCVDALTRTGAAMVGGAMRPVASGWLQRGIAAAMASPAGAGPARFHVGGSSGWVDTVYLGAYRTEMARRIGGYAHVGVNEDAELAIRLGALGGIWFDDSIRSTYVPRSSVGAVARQFYRYGRGRAATVRRHPRSLAPRQLAAPVLVLALCTPWRQRIAVAYGVGIAAVGVRRLMRDPGSALGMTLSLPAMHLSWGAGFLLGLASSRRPGSAAMPADAATT